MNKDKKRLFEAFEKICGVKLIKEDLDTREEDIVKDYLLHKLSLSIELFDGDNDIEDHEFEFEVNGKKYYGSITMTIIADSNGSTGSEYSPDYGDTNIVDIDIKNVKISDEDDLLFVFDVSTDKEFIIKLERVIEIM